MVDPDRNQWTCLVADDDPAIRMLELAAARCGLELKGVGTAREVLEACRPRRQGGKDMRKSKMMLRQPAARAFAMNSGRSALLQSGIVRMSLDLSRISACACR